MAKGKVDNFISAELIKALKQVNDETQRLATNVTNLIKASKGLGEQLDSVNNKENTSTENKKKLTEIEKEALRITKANEKAKAQLTLVETKAAKELAKNRVILQQTNKAIKDNIKAEQAETNSIKQLAAANAKLRIQRDKVNTATKEGQKRIAELNTKINRNTEIIRKNSDATIKNKINIGNYSKSIIRSTALLIGGGGFIGAVRMLSRVFLSGLKIAIEFEKRQAELAGVLGKTQKEVSGLTRLASDLGRTTVFTASQVTELEIAYARLGFSQKEIIQTTADTINAGISLQSNLGETAELVGATLRSFQIDTSQTGLVVDKLTLSTQKSALNFEKLSTTLPIVGSAAKSANVGLSETLALLGAAVDRGIDASTAATSLRNIFIELGKSGIDLDTALLQIVGATDKLSEANNLFGKRAAVTAIALSENISKSKDFTKALNEAGGTAQRVAEVQLNTFDGSLKSLKSAWEGFLISITKTDGALKQFVDSLTFLLNLTADVKDTTDATADSLVNTYTNGAKSAEEYREGLRNAIKAQEGILLSTKKNQKEFKATGSLLDDAIALFAKKDKENKKISDAEVVLSKLRNKVLEFDAENFKAKEEDKTATNLAELQKRQETEAKAEEERLKIRKQELAVEKQINDDIAREDMESDTEARGLSAENSDFQINEAKKAGEIIAKENQKNNDKIIAQEERAKEIREQIEEDLKNARVELAAEAIDSLASIANAIIESDLERSEEKREKDLEKVEQETEEDLAAIEAKQERGILSEEEAERQKVIIKENADAEKERIEADAEKREEEARSKQAKIEAASAIAGIAIEAAQGIATATAQAPATAGASLAWIPLIVASAALQTGVVLANQVPKFFTGTEYSPDTFIAGDRGRELMLTSQGDIMLTPDKPTLYSGMEGTKIIKNSETEMLLSSMNNKNRSNNGSIESALNRNNKQLIRAIKNKRETHVTVSRGNKITERIGNYNKNRLS